MKKLILVAVALFALQVSAQKDNKEKHNKGERGEKMMNLSAEDMATLQTKRMTLALDLSDSQQAKIQKLNLEKATKRKEMMEKRKAKKNNGEAKKPTQEERLAMENARLDHKIAEKAKMKTILNEQQYAKWEKFHARKGKKGGKKGKGHKKGEGKGEKKGNKKEACEAKCD